MTFRIEKSENKKAVTIALSGRLDAQGLAELRKLFDGFKKGRRWILDLKDLRLVDRSAVRFLAFCESCGIRIENCPAYLREWIFREERLINSDFNRHPGSSNGKRRTKNSAVKGLDYKKELKK
jgi:hypothetical protein